MKRATLALFTLLIPLMAMGKVKSQEVQPTSPMLHVTTHMVQVNVIALDHQGNPVSGLKQRDFKVFDSGKPQTISVFRVEFSQPPAVPLPKLPQYAFSNWAERAGYAPPSVTVILLDTLNTRFAGRTYARQQVLKFLEQIKPSDHVALYALGRRLVVLHDFTSDAAPLVAALRHYQGRYVSELHGAFSNDSPTGNLGEGGSGPSPNLSGQEAQSESSAIGGGTAAPETATQFSRVAALMHGIQSLQEDYNNELRIAITTNSLIAIANHLKGLPGRKNLIWVSGGFPMWGNFQKMLVPGGLSKVQNFEPALLRAARAVNDVNLAIYPVDARGIILDSNFSVTQNGFNRNLPTGFDDSIATMAELAQRTGGHAFYNTNDIFGSIRRVVNDSRVAYVLAYYPRDVKWNGEFRKIKVKVDQRGLHLQYRHGYYALPEEKAPVAAHNPTLAAVVNSPLDATGIGLVVQMVPEKNAGGHTRPTYLLKLQIDPRDVKFEHSGGSRLASLTLVTDEFSSKGVSLKYASQKIQIHLEPAVYQKALAEGMGFSESLPLSIWDNAERIRVVIRDDLTGQMGSVDIPLDKLVRRPTLLRR